MIIYKFPCQKRKRKIEGWREKDYELQKSGNIEEIRNFRQRGRERVCGRKERKRKNIGNGTKEFKKKETKTKD